MIFLGDIACPPNKVDAFNSCIGAFDIFKDEVVILNLEATISDDELCLNDTTLINSSHVLDGFSKSKKIIVSLANNHMYDYPDRILPTIDFLNKKNIGVFGLCDHDGSFKPYEYRDDKGNQFAFFGHCWRLYTNTNRNTLNSIRIVDVDYHKFIQVVTEYIRTNPQTQVYCFMHWNYDMEKYPFPMHIKIAHQLIENGVAGVIGSHSHRPQAAEIYKGKPIVYGLGNFYLPSGVFFSGNLTYPNCCKETYALKIDSSEFHIQWFITDDNQQNDPIVIGECESFAGPKISSLSESLKLNFQKYISFFTKNRVKKLLVPVFTHYYGTLFRMKEAFAITRVKILRLIK